jgi:hypothetical protein
LRTWIPRALALAALVAAGVAVLVAVTSVHSKHTTTHAEVAAALGRLSTANRALSSQLAGLHPGASPRGAQAADRTAQTLTKQLLAQFSTDDDLGTRMHVLLDAELAYLDAVGSSVANPHSVLLSKVVELATTLRGALGDTPPGNAADVRGDGTLLTYSTARGQGG